MAKVTREQKKLLKTIKKNPHDSTALTRLGWIHVEQHEYKEAKHRFSQAVELLDEPEMIASAKYGLALINRHAGHDAEAKDLFLQVIRECPNFPKRADVHFELARVNESLWQATEWKNEQEQLESDLFQRAIDHYEQAIERRSEHLASAHFGLGRLYYAVKRYDEAETYLQRAISTGTSLDNTQYVEAHALLGTLFKEVRKNLEHAEKHLELALKKGAKPIILADLYRKSAEIARTQENDDLAVERYEKALKQYGDTQSAHVLDVLIALGELKARHHWFKMAIEYGERALQMSADSDSRRWCILKVLAEGYNGLGEYEKAENYQQQYVTLCEDREEQAEGYLRLGVIREQLEQHTQAAEAYRKGLKTAGHNQLLSRLNGALGRVYLHEDRLNQSVKHLREAIEFSSENDEHASSLYRLLGECYLKREELEKAIEMFGTVIAKFPDAGDEPWAREELKKFRKQLKKESKEKNRLELESERAQEKLDQELENLERLHELIDDILDEKGFFQRLKEGLAKTHLSLVGKIESLLSDRSNVDDELLEDLEEVLILSDLGVSTTQRIINSLQERVKRKELADPSQVKIHLKREVQAILQDSEKRLDPDRATPFVILVIGVNGTGKTTSIGKMASKFKALGKEVMLVAGDTFRAAAIEQLEIWGERAGCEVIKHASGADPSAVMYDAIHAARSRNIDVLIADTAGRLHTKKNLMEELKKMVRIISRELPGAPHEILMVVDATTGQNAISQAKLFHEGIGLSGLILTKLDGTAKGGIIISIAHDLKIPVSYIGIGEHIEDLREFQSREFVEALFED